jgi:hypothetical protein
VTQAGKRLAIWTLLGETDNFLSIWLVLGRDYIFDIFVIVHRPSKTCLKQRFSTKRLAIWTLCEETDKFLWIWLFMSHDYPFQKACFHVPKNRRISAQNQAMELIIKRTVAVK